MALGAKHSGRTQWEACAVSSNNFTQWILLAGRSNANQPIHGSVAHKIAIKLFKMKTMHDYPHRALSVVIQSLLASKRSRYLSKVKTVFM